MYEKIVLDNGLRLVLSDMPWARSISLALFLRVGGCYETESQAGISHFIEHLCFKGTAKRRTAKEISEAIESIGGILNGGTDKELTVYWVRVAGKHFMEALDVVTDLVRNPRFDAVDVDRERRVILEEINMTLDNPRQQVEMLFDELMWPGQPLGRDVAGARETVESITRKQIVDFYAKHYLPDNAVLAIAGDFKRDVIVQAVTGMLGNWKLEISAPRFDNITEQKTARVHIEHRDIEQAHISLGVHGVSIFDEDRFAMDLLSTILGEGMSSRLFVEVRERLGLAYEIGSSIDHFIDSGSFIVHAGVDPARVNEAVASIVNELDRIRDDVTEVELDRAREMAKGRLLLALENSRSVANWLGAQETLTGKIMTVEDITGRIDSITLTDIRRVAQRLLFTEKLNLAIVGPIEKRENEFLNLLKI